MLQYIVIFIIQVWFISAEDKKDLFCKFASDQVSLGMDLEIRCNLLNSMSCLMNIKDRIWTFGSSKTAIYMNGHPRDASGKYKEKNLTCDGVSLVVTNFTETDVNRTYALSVNLLQDEITASSDAINFKYLPKEHEKDKNQTTTPKSIEKIRKLTDILLLIIPYACVSAIWWSARRNRADFVELYQDLPKRNILEWRRPFIASILSIICVVVSFAYGWLTMLEVTTTLISNRILSYTRSAGVSILITLGVITSFDLCFLSNPKTISIREGIINAVKNSHKRIEKFLQVILCKGTEDPTPVMLYHHVIQEDPGNIT